MSWMDGALTVEIMIYDHTLNYAEHDEAERYLRVKWFMVDRLTFRQRVRDLLGMP